MSARRSFIAQCLSSRKKLFYRSGVERLSKLPRVAPSCCPAKAFFLLFCLCACLRFPGVATAQDQLRVAVVDVSKVFKDYYKTKEVEKTLDEARASASQQLDARIEDHHRLIEEVARLEKDLANPALSATAKADCQKKHDDKVQETHVQEKENREIKAGHDRDLRELTMRLRNQIVEDILVVVRARVETSHYDLILNKSGQAAGGKNLVLYANSSLEISDDVIAALNQNHPVVPGAASAVLPEP